MARKNARKDWTLFTCDGKQIYTYCFASEAEAKRVAANLANARQQRICYRDRPDLFHPDADGGACNPL